MIPKIVLFLGMAILVNVASPIFALEEMPIKKIWESLPLIKIPPGFLKSIDFDGNGITEVILNDFSSQLKNHGYTAQEYHFYVLEWDQEAMKIKWEKKWPYPYDRADRSPKLHSFINRILRVQSWSFAGRKEVEAYPPFFHLKWKGDHFEWNEQYGYKEAENHIMGGWSFPFQSRYCVFPARERDYPYECVVGVRNFGPPIGVRVITRVFQDNENKKKVKIKTRIPNKDFSIEWEGLAPEEASYQWTIDSFGVEGPPFLLYPGIPNNRIPHDIWYIFRPKTDGKGYEVKQVKAVQNLWGKFNNSSKKIISGQTYKKGLWEYWGYRWTQGPDGKRIDALQRTHLNASETEILKDEIEFQTHDRFIGIGDFTLEDLDKDGLDEIVFVEQTGIREGGSHGYRYKDVADYIRVAKWDGKTYGVVWTSPPISKRGSKVVVDEILGNGNNQIVVGTGNGTIQIWERK